MRNTCFFLAFLALSQCTEEQPGTTKQVAQEKCPSGEGLALVEVRQCVGVADLANSVRDVALQEDGTVTMSLAEPALVATCRISKINSPSHTFEALVPFSGSQIAFPKDFPNGPVTISCRGCTQNQTSQACAEGDNWTYQGSQYICGNYSRGLNLASSQSGNFRRPSESIQLVLEDLAKAENESRAAMIRIAKLARAAEQKVRKNYPNHPDTPTVAGFFTNLTEDGSLALETHLAIYQTTNQDNFLENIQAGATDSALNLQDDGECEVFGNTQLNSDTPAPNTNSEDTPDTFGGDSPDTSNVRDLTPSDAVTAADSSPEESNNRGTVQEEVEEAAKTDTLDITEYMDPVAMMIGGTLLAGGIYGHYLFFTDGFNINKLARASKVLEFMLEFPTRLQTWEKLDEATKAKTPKPEFQAEFKNKFQNRFQKLRGWVARGIGQSTWVDELEDRQIRRMVNRINRPTIDRNATAFLRELPFGNRFFEAQAVAKELKVDTRQSAWTDTKTMPTIENFDELRKSTSAELLAAQQGKKNGIFRNKLGLRWGLGRKVWIALGIGVAATGAAAAVSGTLELVKDDSGPVQDLKNFMLNEKFLAETRTLADTKETIQAARDVIAAIQELEQQTPSTGQ